MLAIRRLGVADVAVLELLAPPGELVPRQRRVDFQGVTVDAAGQ